MWCSEKTLVFIDVNCWPLLVKRVPAEKVEALLVAASVRATLKVAHLLCQMHDFKKNFKKHISFCTFLGVLTLATRPMAQKGLSKTQILIDEKCGAARKRWFSSM